jgi:hypothetical protein
MTNTQQALARLMGADLYVWCAYPGHGNGTKGFDYSPGNGVGNGYVVGFGLRVGNGRGSGYGSLATCGGGRGNGSGILGPGHYGYGNSDGSGFYRSGDGYSREL